MSESLDLRLFARALAVHRVEMAEHVSRENVPPDYVRQLGMVYDDLRERGYDWEAYEVIRLVLDGVDHVVDPTDRVELSYLAWRRLALTSSFLGLWRESINAYKKAISLGERGAYARIEESRTEPGRDAVYEATDHRELGSMSGRIGAFGDAQESFSFAGERLEEVRNRLDEHTYRDELARLRNAQAIVHMDLGEYEEAESNALAAARIQEALGEEDSYRFLQAAIDYVTAGRSRRELARRDHGSYARSFEAFDDALSNYLKRDSRC